MIDPGLQRALADLALKIELLKATPPSTDWTAIWVSAGLGFLGLWAIYSLQNKDKAQDDSLSKIEKVAKDAVVDAKREVEIIHGSLRKNFEDNKIAVEHKLTEQTIAQKELGKTIEEHRSFDLQTFATKAEQAATVDRIEKNIGEMKADQAAATVRVENTIADLSRKFDKIVIRQAKSRRK